MASGGQPRVSGIRNRNADRGPDALTGYSRSLTWDEVWMDYHWLVAENVGSGSDYGDRKTVLDCTMAA